MKFSWKWLNQIIDLNNIKFDELIDKLTLAGFEIENIYNQNDIKDKTVELSITANRYDTNSIIGLAREVSSILNIPLPQNLDYSKIEYVNDQTKSRNIKINSLYDLKINTITNITQKISPKWLQEYLKGCHIEPQNIFNDIENYIKIKWGQDIEIFDAIKIDPFPIKNSCISITTSAIKKEHDIIISSHKPEVLKYKNRIISTIGIKSNNQIKCDINTSSILVYSKIYNPEYTFQINKNSNIKPQQLIQNNKKNLRCDFFKAYDEAIQLIRTFTGGITGKAYTYNQLHTSPRTIRINKKNIHQILGQLIRVPNNFLHTEEILQILRQLNFKPKYIHNKKIFDVLVPLYREQDIVRPIDIIEEIGRIYGFDKFKCSLPKNSNKGRISKDTQLLKKIRKILRDIGLHEIVDYSLDKTYKSNNYNTINLYNPLTQDQSILQKNISSRLIKIQTYNTKQKNINIEIFEIGRVFKHNLLKNRKYEESIHIAGIIGNSKYSQTSWDNKPEELKWFQCKGILEDLFEKLQVTVLWQPLDKSNQTVLNYNLDHLINPKRTAIIYNPTTNTEIGIFTQLNNSPNKLNLNYSSYLFEINVQLLNQAIKNTSHLDYIFKPYSPYPNVTRDISIILSNNQNIYDIKEQILNINYPLIESVEIFNEYKNKKNKTNRYISIRISYRAKNRTLNDNDLIKIDKEIDRFLKSHNKSNDTNIYK
uniref:phenylalanine--tRNA ligase n=1 Tax=Sebdenia flabellata TaxID=42024 RepID=A0A1C9CA30_9FLOR|nr:phenylalanyl-tRNA synthetase beta chain [Sebdenia flabellata]AOM65238.1 phenylalanyl-tRNA synthetase beta chain [Sebdenia flabellata]